MATVAEMRVAVSKVYPGKAWKTKVAKMPDAQITAIYFNFLKDGRFDKPRSKPKKEVVKRGFVTENRPKYARQLSFFD